MRRFGFKQSLILGAGNGVGRRFRAAGVTLCARPDIAGFGVGKVCTVKVASLGCRIWNRLPGDPPIAAPRSRPAVVSHSDIGQQIAHPMPGPHRPERGRAGLIQRSGQWCAGQQRRRTRNIGQPQHPRQVGCNPVIPALIRIHDRRRHRSAKRHQHQRKPAAHPVLRRHHHTADLLSPDAFAQPEPQHRSGRPDAFPVAAQIGPRLRQNLIQPAFQQGPQRARHAVLQKVTLGRMLAVNRQCHRLQARRAAEIGQLRQIERVDQRVHPHLVGDIAPPDDIIDLHHVADLTR